MLSIMSSLGSDADSELPDIDEHLVVSESRYEIDDGKLVYVPPADEPHADRHSKLAAVLEAHVAPAFNVALDMLTRTSRIDDIAPDASIYPRARNPKTGGRQLEHLAFEIASTEALSHAGRKAAKLVGRGVRRAFAIDVERGRVLEWSRELETWSILDPTASIEDLVFAVPLPIAALVRIAMADDIVAEALLAKHNPVLDAALAASQGRGRVEGRVEGRAEGRVEGRAEGRAEAVLDVIVARGLVVQPDERSRIQTERDLGRLGRWLAGAVTCATVAELLAIG